MSNWFARYLAWKMVQLEEMTPWCSCNYAACNTIVGNHYRLFPAPTHLCCFYVFILCTPLCSFSFTIMQHLINNNLKCIFPPTTQTPSWCITQISFARNNRNMKTNVHMQFGFLEQPKKIQDNDERSLPINVCYKSAHLTRNTELVIVLAQLLLIVLNFLIFLY